jgi:hypothetical protein
MIRKSRRKSAMQLCERTKAARVAAFIHVLSRVKAKKNRISGDNSSFHAGF